MVDVLTINRYANVFVLADFNVHHKDWLTYSGGTDRSGELCYNFSISSNLTQMVNFPAWIPDCDSQLFQIYLFLDTSICSAMAFSPLEYSNHVVVSVSIDFPPYWQWDALFHHIAYDYSRADQDSLPDHLRDIPWEDIFKLSASAAASEVCVGIVVYIPHRKYQAKPHLFPWFSASFAAAIAHRNHFFHLYQKDKSSESKKKFGQASNCCKKGS